MSCISCSLFLVGTSQSSREKLEFKHRLSIALGAAKGDPLQNQWAFVAFLVFVFHFFLDNSVDRTSLSLPIFKSGRSQTSSHLRYRKVKRTCFFNFCNLLFFQYAGLAHLHSLSPRLVHKNFKTANVLVDENFIAKVADAGLRDLLGRVDYAGSSSQMSSDEIFLPPEYTANTILLLPHGSLISIKISQVPGC